MQSGKRQHRFAARAAAQRYHYAPITAPRPEIGPTTTSKVTFLGGQFEELLDELNLTPNVSAANRRQIRVDDARLRMGSITQSFGCIGIAQRRKQEINGGTGRIDGPIQVAPAARHANVGLVHTPGFVSRLEIAPDALLQFWTAPLDPAPHGRMVGL